MLRTDAIVQTKIYQTKVFFWLLAILLGALQAWTYRYNLSTDDAISYLDMGDAYLRGEWNVAINAYWSPLYSWLLSLAISVLRPSIYWEFPVVKLVNFLIYLFALVCFEFFLCELLFYYEKKISKGSSNNSLVIPRWAWVVSGYTLFLWSSLTLTAVYSDTPDLFTTALVYLASGIVLHIHARSDSWLNFIMLGAVLGLAYLSKGAMFPISFAFLGVAMFSASNLRRAFPRVIAALLVFAIVTTPFITALSTAKGRLTFSEAGKLNYAWLVTGGVRPYRFWEGKEPGSGTPKHPPRKIFDNPEVFEFGTPVGGTYPPWYDPSYWYEGLSLKFNFTRQVRILAKNVIYYYQVFFGSLIFSYLILICVNGKFWLSVKDLTKNWMLLIPAAVGLGAYAIGTDMPESFREFQPETRYIAPFIVLLFAGVFSSVRLPNSQESKRLIAGITIAVFLVIGVNLSFQALKELSLVLRGADQQFQLQLADTGNHLGVQPGDKIAILGAYVYPYYYWARLARVKIVAEILDERSFWEKDASVRAEILKTIERTGARVIVHRPGLKIPDSAFTTGWQKIGDNGYYAYFFDK